MSTFHGWMEEPHENLLELTLRGNMGAASYFSPQLCHYLNIIGVTLLAEIESYTFKIICPWSTSSQISRQGVAKMWMLGRSDVRLEVPLRGEKMLKISTLVQKEASRITFCFLRKCSGLFFLAMNFKFQFTEKPGFISFGAYFKKRKRKVLFLSGKISKVEQSITYK